MRYSEFKSTSVPNSMSRMIGVLIIYDSMNKTNERMVNNLKQLFLKNGFFNEFTLSEGINNWIGVKIGATNTGVPFILLRNDIDNIEKRISPKKLLNNIKNDKFNIEYREFKKRELIF